MRVARFMCPRCVGYELREGLPLHVVGNRNTQPRVGFARRVDAVGRHAGMTIGRQGRLPAVDLRIEQVRTQGAGQRFKQGQIDIATLTARARAPPCRQQRHQGMHRRVRIAQTEIECAYGCLIAITDQRFQADERRNRRRVAAHGRQRTKLAAGGHREHHQARIVGTQLVIAELHALH